MKHVYELNRIPDEALRFIGGKAKSLNNMLTNIKVKVPSGYVITSLAFNNGDIKDDAIDEIKDTISSLNQSKTYAVRSSALNEDGQANSFAGQYETITDVKVEGVFDAIKEVIKSSDSSRVKTYSDTFLEENQGIAVVIQEFVSPTYAGVIFTSDVITGSDQYMTGNYVSGEGENLVSGNMNAEVFKINSVKYAYEGKSELKPYAKTLYKYCTLIRKLYNAPMDIEWAISYNDVYILQARPITTLRRLNMDTYEINGSLSNLKLLTRTNVGEIFMKPVSPMTFSVLEKINDILGIPDWLDNIYGQPYMNISAMCSMLISFGMSKENSYNKIKDLVGNLPEGISIPTSPFDRKAMLSSIKGLLFPKNKSKLSRAQKIELVDNLPAIAQQHISALRSINDNSMLTRYWNDNLIPALNDGLAAILTTCGTSLIPLFGTREKIAKVSNPDLSNRLCGGCVGILDSMKPLLFLEDVINNKITKEEYLKACGHRSTNEMELMEPRPYENPTYIDRLIDQHVSSKVNVHDMQDKQKALFDEALKEFKDKYPSKSKWIDKQISKFANANTFRENIRSKGVWIFCVFREYILTFGRINELGDDVFMLTYEDIFNPSYDTNTYKEIINKRKAAFDRYNTYPPFPNLILGRFSPDEWLSNAARRNDFYSALETNTASLSSEVKGFAGAIGVVTGKVKVIKSIDDIDQIENGDILVTTATNIGWTVCFPKVSAIVTDIGAPLSHAAIVAREFGIPAVVGCGNATTVLKTGDIVTVDGANGLVKKA